MTANERFLIVNTKTGNLIGTDGVSNATDGLFVIDLLEQCYCHSKFTLILAPSEKTDGISPGDLEMGSTNRPVKNSTIRGSARLECRMEDKSIGWTTTTS